MAKSRPRSNLADSFRILLTLGAISQHSRGSNSPTTTNDYDGHGHGHGNGGEAGMADSATGHDTQRNEQQVSRRKPAQTTPELHPAPANEHARHRVCVGQQEGYDADDEAAAARHGTASPSDDPDRPLLFQDVPVFLDPGEHRSTHEPPLVQYAQQQRISSPPTTSRSNHHDYHSPPPSGGSIGGVSDGDEGSIWIGHLSDGEPQADCEWASAPTTAGLPPDGLSGGARRARARSPSPQQLDLLLQRARVQRLERQLREIRMVLEEVLPGRAAAAAGVGRVYVPSAPVLSSLSPSCATEGCWSGGDAGVGASGAMNGVRPSLRGGGGDGDEDEKGEADEDKDGDRVLRPVASSVSQSAKPPATPRRPDTPFPTKLLGEASWPGARPLSPQGHRPGTLDPHLTAKPVVTQAQREEAANLWLHMAMLEGYDQPSAYMMMAKYLSGEKDRKIPAMLAEAAGEVARRVQEEEDWAMALALQETENQQEISDNDEEVDGIVAGIRRRQESAVGQGRKVHRSIAEFAEELEQGLQQAGADSVKVEAFDSTTEFMLAKGWLGAEWLCDADDIAVAEQLRNDHQVASLGKDVETLSLSANELTEAEDDRQPFEYDEDDPVLRYARNPRRHRIRRAGKGGDIQQAGRDDAGLTPQATTALGETLLEPKLPKDERVRRSDTLSGGCARGSSGAPVWDGMVATPRQQAEQIEQLQAELGKLKVRHDCALPTPTYYILQDRADSAKTETACDAPTAQGPNNDQTGVAAPGGVRESPIIDASAGGQPSAVQDGDAGAAEEAGEQASAEAGGQAGLEGRGAVDLAGGQEGHGLSN
ncbi:hypothetical protein LTR36_004441 [Oleoguttula mirabilis]|uniref:Fibrous sheath-interacting protein 1 n=1 Tax=Oleoguttula mirabilis TaxID=1507867 RepID=A0AAV9JFX8_9PEZI|nr:hypothetical protein LTR36_004441 [Oleoguttula mirabilis]